jgi:hypothetical protein
MLLILRLIQNIWKKALKFWLFFIQLKSFKHGESNKGFEYFDTPKTTCIFPDYVANSKVC